MEYGRNVRREWKRMIDIDFCMRGILLAMGEIIRRILFFGLYFHFQFNLYIEFAFVVLLFIRGANLNRKRFTKRDVELVELIEWICFRWLSTILVRADLGEHFLVQGRGWEGEEVHATTGWTQVARHWAGIHVQAAHLCSVQSRWQECL